MSDYNVLIKNDFFSFRPRVRLTSFCNRNCRYCFAKEYLSKGEKSGEIDLNSMEEILYQCSEEGIRGIGWQGGEPTLHSRIKEIIELHKKYGVKATVFTNGLIEKEVIESLSGIIDSVLVNCNEPGSYDGDELEQLLNNIRLMQKLYGTEKVAIGINIYSAQMDTSFILDYALQLGINEVRIDITRPSPSNKNLFIEWEKIGEAFDLAKKTHEILCKNSIKYVHFDCPFPFCALSEDDIQYVWDHMNSDLGHGQCSTALDISSDARITSCFCSMQFEGIATSDFSSLTHAWLFIKYLEDYVKWNTHTKEDCMECIYSKRRLCQGGCLGYKLNENSVNSRDILFSQKKLYERAKIVSKLLILYRKGKIQECYDESKNMLKKQDLAEEVEKIYLLCAIYLNKNEDYQDRVNYLLKKSYYPALDAFCYASALKENGFLDIAINIACSGLELEKNKMNGKYKIYYFLYEAYMKKNETEKAYLYLIRFFKSSPKLNKKML